jgi:hypothetical protein
MVSQLIDATIFFHFLNKTNKMIYCVVRDQPSSHNYLIVLIILNRFDDW